MKTISGKMFVESLDDNVNNILKWRANSEIVEDLKKLSSVFFTILGFGIAITIIFYLLDIMPSFYFVLTVFVSMFFGAALKWGANPKGEILRWLKYVGMLLLIPWLIYIADGSILDLKVSLSDILNGINLGTWNVNVNDEFEAAIALTIVLFIGLSFVTVFLFVLNIIIIFTFVILLWLTIKISKYFVGLKEATVKNVAQTLRFTTMVLMFTLK